MRPFKDLKEFKEKTGLDISNTITVRYNQDVPLPEFYLHKDAITCFDYSDKTICIGNYKYSLEVLSWFKYFKDGKWLPFGVEETQKPAKFQVGKKYFCHNDHGYKIKIFINAKYKDPADNKLSVVFNGDVIRTVNTDQDGNETITFCDCKFKAKNEVKE